MALSNNAIVELTEHVESVSRVWVQEYIRVRQATLKKRGIEASGRLVNSLQYGLTKNLNTAVTNTIQLAFEDYGRFVEMKRMNLPNGGQEMIDNLAEWIVRKGFADSFARKFVEKRKLKTVPQNIVNQMAWGIAVKRSKAYRRKVWYAKSKSAAITDLFNQVAAGIPDIVLDELKAAFAAKK